MTMKRKLLLLIGIFLTLFILGSVSALGENSTTKQPDELWAKAVLLASQNQALFPENICMKSQVLNSKGEEKYSVESWEQLVETENGSLELELIKKLENGKDVTELEKGKKESKKKQTYNIDLSDLTLPFSQKTQSSITLERLNRIENKAGRDCVVYNFTCVNSRGDHVFGKAWLSHSGVPVAMSYGYDPLPKRISKQVKDAVHEVHYRYDNNGEWYPERVLIELKNKYWFVKSLTYIEGTFSDYRQPKLLGILTGGKLHIARNSVHEIPFEYLGEHIYIKVKINDFEKEYKFLFDTGAATTVLNPRTAAALNFIKAAEMSISDGFISKAADVVVVEKLSLGEITVENCGAVIFDMEKLETALNTEIDGILGSNFLRLFTIRIDYSKKEIAFTTNQDYFLDEIKKSHRISLIQGSTGLIFAPFNISGIETPFNAEIDTGANNSLMIPVQYMEQFKPALNSKVVKCLGLLSGGAFGESDGMITRLGEFKIGDLSFENLVVIFENRKNDFLILGNDFLSCFNLIIDYPKNEMFLLPLADKKFETNIKNFGFYTIENKNGKIEIITLLEDSMAEKAGLKVGDVILRIVAGEESGTTYEEFKRISDKYDTIRLFVQRDNGEKEIVVNKTRLFPEVK
ncbi:MAG: hypothetical protein GXY86_03715 [Firmicutes bacterium]|nr:hypothetical protein [Bacillota bacterium]